MMNFCTERFFALWMKSYASKKHESDWQDYRAEYETRNPDRYERTDARPLETRKDFSFIWTQSAESTYERLRFKSISRVHKGRGGRRTGKWRAVV